MAFVQRLLQFTFALGEGTFGGGGSNQITVSGLRASVKVARSGGPAMGTLDAVIYGMTDSQMNSLTTLGLIATTHRRNSVTVQAGDSGSALAVVFTGTIRDAWGDYNSQPEVGFRVMAQTGFIEALEPVPPTSVKGNADVAALLSGLAAQMNISFENNGVSISLSNPYLSGSPRVQARQIVEQAGIEWNGMDNGVLAIWNPGDSRGGSAALVSINTGMIGYPSFTSQGIRIRSVFNPSIGFGQKIQVQSSLPKANGVWKVCDLDYELDTLTPNGKWELSAMGAPVGLGPIVPS